MSDKLKFLFLGFLGIFFLGFLTAHSGCELYNEYTDCIDFYQLSDKISNIYSNTSTFNIDYNLYLDCVMEQKNQRIFDYSEIRNFCFSALTTKRPNFNVKCSYELNNLILEVNCKGIYPTKDFEQKIDIISDKNGLQIIPTVLLNSDYSLSKIEFVFTKKSFNLLEKKIPKPENIIIAPLKVEIKDSSEFSFLNTPMQSADLDDIYKSYLDCLTIKGLFSKTYLDKYIVRKSGYDFSLTKEELIESCIGDLSFSFIADFKNYDLKRNEFRTYLENSINDALSEQEDYSTEFMSSYFNNILEKYSDYLFSINKYKDSENILKLSLDPDYLFEDLLRITRNMSNNDKLSILESASSTILKNKEDVISIRRKESVSSILSFFDSDIKQIDDKEISELYLSIEEIILKNHFKDNEIIDMCDVNFVLTPKSINLNTFAFDFSNNIKICLEDEVLISQKDNEILLFTKDYNFNTALTLDIKDKIYVSNKEVNILDNKTIKNNDFKEISLIYDVVPIYVITKERKGKLLGIINIVERITEKYNASNKELYSTEKPWWDFLVIYR